MVNISDDVIQKEVVSISLKDGLDEHEQPTSVDWTKYFTKTENCDFDDYGVIKKCKGSLPIQAIANEGLPGAFGDIMRMVNLNDGLGFIRRQSNDTFQLSHLNESLSDVENKGFVSPWMNYIETIASTTAIGIATPNQYFYSIGITDKYKAIVYQVNSLGSVSNTVFEIVLTDLYSNNIVRRWTYTYANPAGVIQMVVVDSTILHFYVSVPGGLTNGLFFRIDTNTLPSNGILSPATTTLASTDLIIDVVSVAGSSVSVSRDGDLERFNAAGTSTQTATVAGFTIVGSMDTDGSNLYIVGQGGGTNVLKTVNSSFVTTRTATATLSGTQYVAVRPSDGQCCILTASTIASTSTVTYNNIAVAYVASGAVNYSNSQSFRGFLLASQPVYVAARDTFLVAASNVMTTNAGIVASVDPIANACVLINLGTSSSFTREPEAVLSGYTVSAEKPNFHRPVVHTSTNSLFVCTASKSTSTSFAFDLNRLYMSKPEGISSTTSIVSGGLCTYYDGDVPTELGWLSSPSCFTTLDTGGGTNLAAGLYNYVVVFEYKHLDGTSRFSRVSRVSSIVLPTTDDVRIEIVPPDVGKTFLGTTLQKHTVAIYRTTSGGTEFYQVFNGPMSGAGVLYSYVDQIPDATLLTRPRLFRQPSVAGSPKDRYHPLSAACVVRHKDRVFLAHRNSVYYSSFDVDGETTWFNPEFTFFIPGGSGYITGLASIDGSLVIFKEDAIFIVDGDGPPENGGSGLEFSPPRRIQTRFGCIDQRSIMQAPDCVMFRSKRGIELISRNLTVVFAGEKVSQSVDSHPVTCGCDMDLETGTIFYVVAESQSSTGVVSGTRILTYNIASNAWSYITPTLAVQDISYARVFVGGSNERRMVLGSADVSLLSYLTDSTFLESNLTTTVYRPMDIETASVRIGSVQDRILATELLLLVENKTNHDLHISAAYNGSSVFEDEQVFEADWWVGEEIKQVIYQLPRTDLQSVRFRIVDTAPSDSETYPVGTGEGPQILDVSVKVGKVGGGAQLGWESTINNV